MRRHLSERVVRFQTVLVTARAILVLLELEPTVVVSPV